MPGAWLILAIILDTLGWIRSGLHSSPKSPTLVIMGGGDTCNVLTDLCITFLPADEDPSTKKHDGTTWHRIEKDLYLGSGHGTAWLQVASAAEECINPEDLVITDITIDE